MTARTHPHRLAESFASYGRILGARLDAEEGGQLFDGGFDREEGAKQGREKSPISARKYPAEYPSKLG